MKPICRQKSAVTIQKPMTIPLERSLFRSAEERAGFCSIDSTGLFLLVWIKQAASIPGWDGGSTRDGGSPL
ncbi:MAG: hypothetical protein ACM3SU_06065 [Acidobacteriota bacterium]